MRSFLAPGGPAGDKGRIPRAPGTAGGIDRDPRPPWTGAGLLILGMAIPLLLSSLTAGPQRARNPSAEGHQGRSRRTPVVEVAERVSPAVAAIEVARDAGLFRRFQPRGFKGEGSGVIINAHGYLLTNYHVVADSVSIRVMLPDGSTHQARVVALSEGSDLALLRIQRRDGGGSAPFPFIFLGSSGDLLPGETVVALGNPYGLQHTVSTGVVSAVNRTVQLPNGRRYHDFVQTDAAINPGNSGGALVNLSGDLIGINTAILNQGWGIAFAIPVDRVKELLAEYVRTEHFTGITAQKSAAGLEVVSVEEGSPAEKEGIRAGDRLLAASGHALRQPFDLVVASLGATDRSPLALEYERKGRRGQASIAGVSRTRADDSPLWKQLGLRGRRDTTSLRGNGERVAGLRIESLRPGGPAAMVDMREG
ncbi:MAG: S1C family serine protease, partial [Planctomycetota bacterium]